MAITDYLERGALINADGTCLRMGAQRLSYRETVALMNRVANALISDGFGVGHNVGVLSDNDLTAFVGTLGVMRSGAAYVPMDFRNTLEQNVRILDFADCEALFYQRRFHEQVVEIRRRLPALRLTICLEERLDADGTGLAEWLAPYSAAPPRFEIPLEAPAWLQSGSGTSDDFKMTIITHRAYHAFVAHALLWLPDPFPVMLVAAPMTHAAGGLAYHVLAVGGSLVLIEKPDPQAVLSAIEEHGITKLFLPPTVVYRLLAQENVGGFDTSSLRYLAFSAAPMAVGRVRETLETFGPVLAQGYGQTECLGIASMRPEEYYENGRIASDFRLSAAGRPALPFSRVAIVSEEGDQVPIGEVGEICARGDQVMAGYYKDPLATRETIVDGWLHTGDLGFMDDEGYLHVVDRKKDVIISGGLNVFPSEIERAVASFGQVENCAVIGVPDAEWGETIKAVVQLRPGAILTEAEVIARCRERVGSVQAPKSVDFVDELPGSARGKVLRRVLRDRYWEGRPRKV